MNPNTYGRDNTRLMQMIRPGQVGGYVVTVSETEELVYAVYPDGSAKVRKAKRPNPMFQGTGWRKVDTVPANAEWIGHYAAP